MSKADELKADPREIRGTLRQLCDAIGCRVAGSRAEAKARRWLVRRFREIGLAGARVEEFAFDNSSFRSCDAKWFAGRERGRLDARPMAYCPSTPGRGIEGDVVFLGSAERVHEQDDGLKGKVGLFLGVPMPDPEFLRSLCACGISAALIMDHRTHSSWPVTLNYPAAWAKLVTIPMFSVPYDQGWKLGRKRGADVRLSAKCRRFRSTSGNVVANLPGRTQETIVVSAHIDSVWGSVGGCDDASGIALIVEVARLLAGRKRRRAMRFLGAGLEERLSIGAYHHTRTTPQKHTSLALTFDSVGAALGVNQWHVTGSPALQRFLKRRVNALGFDACVQKTVTPYSDHFPFNMLGIPAAWLYRPSCTSGNWFFHSANDAPANVSADVIAHAATFVARLLAELADMRTWPFRRTIPPAAMREVRQYAEWMYGPMGRRGA